MKNGPAPLDPTEELLRTMAAFHLNPKVIHWDGRLHRFPGARKKRGTAGWYIAYPDRNGAHFGDWSSGVKQHWIVTRTQPVTDAEREKWTEEKKARAKELAKKREIARNQIEKVWTRAVKPDPKTDPVSYLLQKGIGDYLNLKVSTLTHFGRKKKWSLPAGVLLIPMYRDGERVNLQRIYSDGEKQFWPGADPIGAYFPFGLTKGKLDTVYICEGWATGWSIWKATGCPVLAAFTAGNLEAVARMVYKKRDPKRIIIAADNDRWTKIIHAGELDDIPNPGVYYAEKAARAIDSAEVTIPDFEELEGKPTDFDDLRLLEGDEAVKVWLDPEMADQADTVAEVPEGAEDADIVAEAPEEDAEDAEPREEHVPFDDAPFKPLGVHEGVYYAMAPYGQIVGNRVSSLSNRATLIDLARLQWWQEHFKGGTSATGNVNWTAATDAFMDACQREGVFQPGRVRGRGFWRDDDSRIVSHFGDRLLPPDVKHYVDPEHYGEHGSVYPRLQRMAGPSSKTVMDIERTRKIVELFEDLPLESRIQCLLLLGWLVLAPFSGALPWRPHAWIGGPSGCGKSTILEQVIRPLLAGMAMFREGMTTEAGIRQHLGSDCLPVIIDENEQNDRKAAANVQNVLRLARSASSGGTITKGTPHGKELTYEVRSMYLFSSIVVSLRHEADKTRVSVLMMKDHQSLDPDKRRKDWNALKRRIDEQITTRAGRELVARTLQWFRDGRFDQAYRVTRRAVETVLGDARAADQYGTLLTGVQMLMSDEIPNEEEARHWLKDLGLGAIREKPVNEGLKVLERILQADVIFDDGHRSRRVPAAELIDCVRRNVIKADPSDGVVTAAVARKALQRCGLRVMLRSDRKSWVKEDSLLVGNRSVWVNKLLRDTPYRDGWRELLRSLPGAEVADKQVYYYSTLSNDRSTRIPLTAIGEPPTDEEHRR